nr:type II toxin-antitoxin system VapC family toxin [Neisseria sp. 19428wB4_WF04]
MLDTNIISEMRKIKRGTADKGLTSWLATADSGVFYTSPIVVMELERGILLMERKDQTQGAALRAWYGAVMAVMAEMFAGRILPIDRNTAAICAKLHTPNPAPENDARIAATAIQHRLTLVTRNTADFRNTKTELFNPFAV